MEAATLDAQVKTLVASLPNHKGWLRPLLFQYKGVWLHPETLPLALQVEGSFKTQDADLLLATPMKVGTTWLKALALAITRRRDHCPINDPHHPLLTINPHLLVPSLEFQGIENLSEAASTAPSIVNQRLYHTHLPYSLMVNAILASKCKVVYLCRNAGDTFVSMWKFFAKLRPKEIMGDFPLEEAFDMFCNGVSPFGSYWDHVLGYWKASKERPDKFLFMTYEELQTDQANQVRRLANFLAFPFTAEEEKQGFVEETMKLCSFDNLAKLEVNKTGELKGYLPLSSPSFQFKYFFRKGIVGDSAAYLTGDMVNRLNAITDEHFKGYDLKLRACRILYTSNMVR